MSSSEAEFVSLSEAAKEVKCIVQVIESMEIKVKKPVTINNIGAIYMAKDSKASQHSKHIDVRYKYVTEFIDERFCEVIFVKTEINQSDGFTKNLDGNYIRNTPRILSSRRKKSKLKFYF